MKREQLEHWDELFALFKKEAVNSGSIVFEAHNAKDAASYITKICKQYSAKYVIKSKSMTSEEIFLNNFLENNGIVAIESDLGEWIIQQCKERPSHMVMPAIHKNRKQVAAILSKVSKQYIDENDTALMVKTARELLRNYYFDSQIGITGQILLLQKVELLASFQMKGMLDLQALSRLCILYLLVMRS